MLNEKDIQEILELAQVAEQKMKEATEMAMAVAQKCEGWHEAQHSVKP
jgi:hypothetical protein